MVDQPAPDESGTMPEPVAKGGTTIPVAGIGGSAGGLEVVKHLLADLPADAGLAIVFVQHLDPKHHSMLWCLGSRCCTNTMARPASAGKSASRCLTTSNPPADPPMPATGMVVPPLATGSGIVPDSSG